MRTSGKGQANAVPSGTEFTRRRYGGKTLYCWATAVAADGTRLDLGDPWPGSRWPNDVVGPLARAALARHAGDNATAVIEEAAATAAQARRLKPTTG